MTTKILEEPKKQMTVKLWSSKIFPFSHENRGLWLVTSSSPEALWLADLYAGLMQGHGHIIPITLHAADQSRGVAIIEKNTFAYR